MVQNLEEESGTHPEGDRSWIWKKLKLITNSDMSLFSITILILCLSTGLYWDQIPGWSVSILILAV